MHRLCLLVLTLSLAVAAAAQEEVIMLSPFEVSTAKATEKPPIVIKKRADFLLLEISLVNDTREEERRRDEVYATLHTMVGGIPRDSKIELFTQEFTLSASHYQIPLVDVSQKRDTSSVTLYAKVPLSGSDDVGTLAETLRAYVRGIKGEGRTEIFSGDLGLSIRNPEKYRYEVIQAIAADVKKLRETFGDSFEVVVKGLDARLKWERASISEVELFLPFSYEVFPTRANIVLPVEK